MDDGESSAAKNRKRTESSGGSSDSELSEGWNIIDQADVSSHDVPSSDGESVEVIDAEDESRGNVTDTEVEGGGQLAPVLENPIVSASESETAAIPQEIPREEMFNSSFCWFLFFATTAVLVSNLAFMVAENAFTWNMDVNIEAPSFLRDLPTTPKLMNGNSLIQNIPWAGKDEVMVEIIDECVTRRDYGSKYDERSQTYEMNKKQPYKQPVETFEKHTHETINNKPYKKLKKPPNEKYNKQQSERWFNRNQNEEYEHQNDKSQNEYFKFDGHDTGRYLNALTEIATSSETREKLNQVLLILDGLHIGLNDLDEVVTKNSELQDVVKKQKHKLSQVLSEMEYGVSKSLDRVASNILNKVRKLERRFESQWCKLEKRGHQEELKGLFYDCPESEEKTRGESEHLGKMEDQVYTKEREGSKIDVNWNNYQYQVDRDSPGKEQSNARGNEAKEVQDYYTLVKSEMQNNVESLKEQIHIKHESDNEPKTHTTAEKNNKDEKSKYRDDKQTLLGDGNDKIKFTEDKRKHYTGDEKHYDDKRKHYDNNGKQNSNKEKYYDDKEIHDDKKKYDDKAKFYHSNRKHDERRTFYEDKRKHTKQYETHKTYKSTEQDRNKDHRNNREQTKSEKSYVPNLEPELIKKYLKESCDKGRNKINNMYEKLKGFLDSKLQVPKKMFDSLFAKYCQANDDSFKWEKRFNRKNPKGDFSGKNNKNMFKDELVIEDNIKKNMGIINILEVNPEDKVTDPTSDSIVVQHNQPRQWVFSYEDSSQDNNSNLIGDWFFQAGESRSKLRWSHHRGDWWFERSSHRRTHPRPPPIQFSGRRKNWYFRRAWARQNCRHSQDDNWCDKTVAVPNRSYNFR